MYSINGNDNRYVNDGNNSGPKPVVNMKSVEVERFFGIPLSEQVSQVPSQDPFDLPLSHLILTSGEF